MAPGITVIAPAHNEEASIRVAVRNLLELDYPQLEVIVVNGGSEDLPSKSCGKSSACGRSALSTFRKPKVRQCVDRIEAISTQG